MNNDDIKKLLGLKIKSYRMKLGISQEKLSEKIGVTQRQISLIELGLSFPKPSTLTQFCTVFNCNAKDLFDFEIIESIENVKKELQNSINTLPEDKIRILHLISKNL